MAATLSRPQTAQPAAVEPHALFTISENLEKYTPKEKIANWLESYVDILGINFWIETGLEGASYDATHGC